MKRFATLGLAMLLAFATTPARAAELTPLDPATIAAVAAPAKNKTFGTMYFPRLKSKFWGQKLISSVAKRQLDAGIGWFTTTAMPGELGNFAVAGHRATFGEPLAYVDKIRKGDKLFIKTSAAWFVYRMTHDQITLPTAMWVLDPVPGDAWDAKPTKRLITIVTCEPRYGSSKRWIWWGELAAAYPATATLAEVQAASA